MDRSLDEQVATARARVHRSAEVLREKHRAFVQAGQDYNLALADYREANHKLCLDDKKTVDVTADALELALSSDSEARLKAAKDV